MKVGDLVEYCDDFLGQSWIGIVTEINHWVDKGAPSRNFGTDIIVALSDGKHIRCCITELRLINEARSSSHS